MGKKLIEKFKEVFEPKGQGASSKKGSDEQRIHFDMPEPAEYDWYHLPPLLKRKVTICNLFANHQKTIPEICELLEVSRKLVIDTLVENKLLKDRRKTRRPHTPAPEELKTK